MPQYDIPEGEVAEVISESDAEAEAASDDWDGFVVDVSGATVRFAHDEKEARRGRKIRQGQTTNINPHGKPLYGYAVNGDASVEADLAGFSLTIYPPKFVAASDAQSGEERTPRTDSYEDVNESGVPIDADSAVAYQLDMPDRAAAVVVSAEFDAVGYAEVHFCDNKDDWNTITMRGPDDSDGYSSDGSGKLFTETAVASDAVRVEFHDNSGSPNSVDLNIYGR